MSNSLRDQLLKAGLVTEEQAREAARQKGRKAKDARRNRKSGKPVRKQEDGAARAARRAQAEKAARDKALNREQEDLRRRQARNAQAREILEQHSLNDPNGEIAHNFTWGERVRRVYVNAEQHKGLAEGKLVIAMFKARAHIINPDTAAKLEAIDPKFVVKIETGAEEPDPDDPYKDYKVPDDLMW